MRFATLSRRSTKQGFTLIELLIVVAIVGIIAAILIPNLLDSLQKAKQKRTVGDIRDLGVAWFSWMTDQISAAAAGSSTRKLDFEQDLPVTLTQQDLEKMLYVSSTMFYIQEVPTRDGWGRNYDFRWTGPNAADMMIGIRSYGRDGQVGPTSNPYPIEPFVASSYDEDIVWADGYFIRYPAGAKTQ